MSIKLTRLSAWLLGTILVGSAAGSYWISRSRPNQVRTTVALIPQTSGVMLWDGGRRGATEAAAKYNYHVYWNAPRSENDIEGQVSLIDRVVRGHYQALVVAPDHTLAIVAPLRRALAARLPVVVVSEALPLAGKDGLSYILNDDARMGELGGEQIARAIHGQGSVAILGLAPFRKGIALRARSAELYLRNRFPDIHVVARAPGAFDAAEAQEAVSAMLDSHPELDGILSLTAVSTRAAYATLPHRFVQRQVKLVGCEQDYDLLSYLHDGEIEAIVAENTYRMGYEAINRIASYREGKAMESTLTIPPLVITKRNLGSPETDVFTVWSHSWK